ncbi:MAG: hypothetical protein ACRCWJ_02560 [Casimicrobium sp.]
MKLKQTSFVRSRASAIASLLATVALSPAFAQAPAPKVVQNTQCTAIKMCYCVNDEFLPLIDEKVKALRAMIAAERAKGKAIGYFSVPLSTTGGGYFNVNVEVSNLAKERIETRFGKDQLWILNPAMKEADLTAPSGARGGHGEYMLMWTRVLEGANALGEDFDFVYFAGPSDFAAFFGLTGTGDMETIGKYFDKRLAEDTGLKREVERGRVNKNSFRNYYALRASVSFSNGAHDEWNIVRILNERRRADPKFGNSGQIPKLFDGKAVSSGEFENPISAGSPGACKVN